MKRFVRFTAITLFIITAIAPVFFEKYLPQSDSNVKEGIAMLIPLAISAASALYSNWKSGQAQKKHDSTVNGLFNKRENDLTNYYNDEYYRDRMKDADSQSALAAVRDQLQEQSKKYANQFAASGATPEAKIAANTEANKTYAGTVNKLYGYGQQYKNQVRQNYLNGMNALYGQKINFADNALNSTQDTWGNVAQGIGNAISDYTLADAYKTPKSKELTPTMKGIIGQGGFETGY